MRLLLALALSISVVVPAAAQTVRHKLTAPSGITIETTPGKDVPVETGTSSFEAYSHWLPNVMDGSRPRVAKMVVLQRHEEGVPGKVDVTVYDVSQPKLREVVRFSDPGGRARIVGQRYFVATEPGCCALSSRHHVRLLETGKPLFSSTGDSGEAGTAIWMSVPNAKPTIERWVAFEGELGRDDYSTSDQLGVIRYGGWDGAISTVVLKAKSLPSDPESAETKAHIDLMESLTSCGVLGWVENGTRLRPLTDRCAQPGGHPGASLFSLERKSAPDGIGGITIELATQGKVYATIPIERDRLDLARATVADGLVLVEEWTP